MLKKILFIMLSAMIFISCASVGKFDNQGDFIFWKVDNGKNTIYLLGSIHVGKPDIYPLADTIENAFNQTKNLALELDLSNLQNDIQTILKYSFLSGDTTLKDLVPDSTYNLITEKLENKVNPLYINKYRPWFATLIIMQEEMKAAGFSNEYGIDHYFTKKANAAKKKILEVEQLEDQLKLFLLFDKVPNDYLHYALKEAHNTEKDLERMYDNWVKGDIQALNEFINSQSDGSPEFENIMNEILFKRNIKMANSIKKILDSGESCFVILGSAHLIGEKSIIEILKKSGKFNIDRI